MIHRSYQVKANNLYASYDEPLIRIDYNINDPPILSSQGEQRLRDYDEPLTRTDNRINDTPILSIQGEQPLGEIRQANELVR